MQRLFITIVFLLLLVIVGAAGVLWLVDPNDYRDEIAAVVEERTDREFVIEGDISWTLYPRLGIDLGAWRLGSGEGFDDQPFASAESLRVGMALPPLFRGRIELETLEIDRPALHLIRNAEGLANWEGLFEQAGANGDANNSNDADGNGALPGWIAALTLGGIELSDGRIRHEDRTTDSAVTVDPVNVSLGSLAFDEPSSFELTGVVEQAATLTDTRVIGDLVVRRDGSLSLRDTAIEIDDLTLTELALDARPTDAGWRFHPISARFYEGDYTGDVRLDTAMEGAPLHFDEVLSGISIGPLVAVLADFDRLTGEASINANGRLLLAGTEPALATLDADGEWLVRDGAIRGINVARTIRSALARIEGRSLDEPDGTPSTDFTSLSGTFGIRQGVVRSDDIALDSPLLRIRGGGSTDLVDETLDLALDVTVVDTLEGQDGEPIEALQGATIPVRITGSWEDPRIRVNLEQALEEAGGEQLRERLEREVDDLRERLEEQFDRQVDDLREQLRGLFD